MKFTIEEGRIHVWSADEAVHLIIVPRRSTVTDPTLVQVRSEPMPMFEVQPELATDIPGEWVWTGTMADASRIVDLTCFALLSRLDPSRASSPRTKAWRAKVLSSLKGSAPPAPIGKTAS